MVYTGITKGVAFKALLVTAYGGYSNGNMPDNQSRINNYGYYYISKDGGSWSACTNKGTSIVPGVQTLQLTDSEMNADRIDIAFYMSQTGDVRASAGASIFTGSAGLSAADVWNYAINELSSLPTVSGSIGSKLQALFQYFFNKRTVTIDTMSLIKDDDITVLGTGSVSDDGTTVVKGKIS